MGYPSPRNPRASDASASTSLPTPVHRSDAVRSLRLVHQLLRAERSSSGSTPVINECLRLVEQALGSLGQPLPAGHGEHVTTPRQSLHVAGNHEGSALPVGWPSDPRDPAIAVRSEVDLQPPDMTPAAARAFVRDQCLGWGVAAVAMNAAIDVASELVTNAQQHGRGSRAMTLSKTVDRLVIEVADGNETPPRRLPYRRGFSEHGLGLALVQRLCADWGYHPLHGGKVVWATVPTTAAR